ncbi:hypothetical protein [Clostridium formicaceticum]|uniref:Uncharacterized protein n=1 Tax=Clostridium formicaceticum TaxID=1497 RepID=A0AAC9RQ38_9CLOT|nr:hypothetical protein [Clostridium formicaceticum]AOY74541.1 hypothetical protein BJL90_00375 [Clostridium formicaceticum]ARE88898.1 hypothetical protein CLFO_33040 [Clostridium formicaceticum]
MKLRNFVVHCSTVGLLLICLSGVFSPKYVVYAAETMIYTKDTNVVINAEETEWRYRVVDGRLQKRLWSITYNKWLTDWEWV